ncbi:MAG TPA: ATP-binding protein [Actinomycetota bacterium]|nr:ATP-binding protein [Actinomycetota bacterium]
MRSRRTPLRVLAYAALAAYVVALYFAIAWLGDLAGMPAGSLLPALVATTAISLTYARARQVFIDFLERRFGSGRISPEEAATQLLQKWVAEVSTSELLTSVAEVIGRATGAAWVEIRPTDGSWSPSRWESRNAKTGDDDLFEHVLPIVFEGELLGEIAILSASPEGPTPKERELIAGLSDQIALTIRNAMLTSDVRRQIEEIIRRTAEVRAARLRTVEAQDSERRMLERNIHDGMQQYLVAMAVKLSLAKRSNHPDKAAEAMAGVARLAGEALARLEELTSGVSSQVLLEEGLESALRKAATASPVPVEIENSGVGRLPEEAEIAVYFSCLEALQNAIKHAEASTVHITLKRERDELIFSVSDDGKGFDANRVEAGLGLRSLSDRLAGLEGSLEINSGQGDGTEVVGRVPISEQRIR